MKAIAIKTHSGNWLPAIKVDNAPLRILWGEPLATKQTAIKYAQIEINSIRATIAERKAA